MGDVSQREERTVNEYQRRAYEAPVDEETAPASSLTQGENNHTEICHGVQVSVVLTADIGSFGRSLFGQQGAWHCSVAVWPGVPGPPAQPIPMAKWTSRQLSAAEEVAIRNLAGVGELATGSRKIRGQQGLYAIHCYLPMSAVERTGLGLG